MPLAPTAFLIGAMKAGTTSLATWLDQHTLVSLARPKEPAFFTRNWDRGLDWYRARFTGPDGALCLDASTAYSNAPTDRFPLGSHDAISAFAGVPRRVQAVCPEARFIYVLRDPVERTHSAYWHARRQGQEPRSFRQAITEDTGYLRASDYLGQLQLYLEFYPLSAFQLLVFETMIKAPEETARTCLRFLGIDDRAYELPRTAIQKNRSFQFNLVGRALSFASPGKSMMNARSKRLIAKLPPSVRAAGRLMLTDDIPVMNDDDRHYLIGRFRQSTAALESFTGLDLAGWQR